jgi:hypothetical protein
MDTKLHTHTVTLTCVTQDRIVCEQMFQLKSCRDQVLSFGTPRNLLLHVLYESLTSQRWHPDLV